MKQVWSLIFVLYTVHLLTFTIYAQEETTTIGPSITTEANEFEDINPNNSYCLRFTWMGTDYDNSTKLNTTCDELMQDTNAENVPCKQPLVITYDGTPPDLEYLWEHHQSQVACKKSNSEVCARYSYSFNDYLLNVTYMCTKVFTTNEGPETSGCYNTKVDGYDVELCLCNDRRGSYMPCNSATINSLSIILALFISSVYLLSY